MKEKKPESIKVPQLSIEDLYKKTLETGIAFQHNALPHDVFLRLQDFTKTLPDRTSNFVEESISKNVISELGDVKDLFTKEITQGEQNLIVVPNTALIKHYFANKEHSRAYNFHRDPSKYKGISVLLSIDGEAFFQIQDSHTSGVISIKCSPNTLITMLANNEGVFPNENQLHRITPPLNGKDRYMLFLGTSKFINESE